MTYKSSLDYSGGFTLTLKPQPEKIDSRVMVAIPASKSACLITPYVECLIFEPNESPTPFSVSESSLMHSLDFRSIAFQSKEPTTPRFSSQMSLDATGLFPPGFFTKPQDAGPLGTKFFCVRPISKKTGVQEPAARTQGLPRKALRCNRE